MADNDSTELTKCEKKCKNILNKTLEKCAIFLFIFAIIPAHHLHASMVASPATISVSATVPLTPEFSQAVARNSRVALGNSFAPIGENEKITVIISNGETILKNQSFFCKVTDNMGAVIYSQQGKSGEDGVGGLVFSTSGEIVGKKNIQCEATGYEQTIILDKKPSLFLFPATEEALRFFIR